MGDQISGPISAHVLMFSKVALLSLLTKEERFDAKHVQNSWGKGPDRMPLKLNPTHTLTLKGNLCAGLVAKSSCAISRGSA